MTASGGPIVSGLECDLRHRNEEACRSNGSTIRSRRELPIWLWNDPLPTCREPIPSARTQEDGGRIRPSVSSRLTIRRHDSTNHRDSMIATWSEALDDNARDRYRWAPHSTAAKVSGGGKARWDGSPVSHRALQKRSHGPALIMCSGPAKSEHLLRHEIRPKLSMTISVGALLCPLMRSIY